MFPFLANIIQDSSIVARVEFQDQYIMKLISVVHPAHEAELTEWVQRMNEKDQMHIRVSPPQDAPMFSNYGRALKRDQAEFFEAFSEYTNKYYGRRFEKI